VKEPRAAQGQKELGSYATMVTGRDTFVSRVFDNLINAYELFDFLSCDLSSSIRIHVRPDLDSLSPEATTEISLG
jgi:hypothetical protein